MKQIIQLLNGSNIQLFNYFTSFLSFQPCHRTITRTVNLGDVLYLKQAGLAQSRLTFTIPVLVILNALEKPNAAQMAVS